MDVGSEIPLPPAAASVPAVGHRRPITLERRNPFILIVLLKSAAPSTFFGEVAPRFQRIAAATPTGPWATLLTAAWFGRRGQCAASCPAADQTAAGLVGRASGTRCLHHPLPGARIPVMSDSQASEPSLARTRFKFCRRTVLVALAVLCSVFAVVAASVAYVVANDPQRQFLKAAAAQGKGYVIYDGRDLVCFASSVHVTDDDLPLLVELGHGTLDQLDIHDSSVTDAGMVHLRGLKKLEKFGISSEALTDRGLAELAFHKNLTRLDISRTRVTDTGLAFLSGLPQLKELHLDYTPVTDAGLAHLAGLKNLESLRLVGTKITDAGLVHLRETPHLRMLVLSETTITDAGMIHLAPLRELSMLILYRTRVGGAGFEHFRGMSNLSWLYLMESPVEDTALEHLSRLPNLSSLELDGSNGTDAGLAHLAGAPNLDRLSLSGTRVTDAGLGHLKGNSALRMLWIMNCPDLTDAAVAELQKALPRCTISHRHFIAEM